MARSVSSLADTARAHRALSTPPLRDFLNLKSTPPSPPEKTLTSLSSPTEQLAVCSQLCRQTHLGPRPPCPCPGWRPGVKISVPEKEQAGGECFLGAEGKVTRGGRLVRRGPQGGTWKPGEGPLAPTPCPPHACWAEGLGRAGPSPSLPGDSHAHDGRGLVRLVGLVPSSWVFTASWREIGQGSVMGCCQTVSKRKPDTAPDGLGGVRVPGRRLPSASATAPCAGPERPPSSLLPRRSASGQLQRAACAFAVNAE